MKHVLVVVVAAALLPATACRKASDTPAATSAAPAGSSAAATPAPVTAPAGAPASPAAAAAAPIVPKPVPAQLPEVLARVNGQDVKKTDFDMLVKDLELGPGGPIPAERRDEVMRATLDRLVTYTLLSQEAKARNLTATDAEIEERLKQMQTQFPNVEDFKKALGQRNMTLERLRSDTRTDLVISKMMDLEVSTTPGASDAEAKEFYDKNPDSFKQPEQLRASHILIRVDEKADDAAKKKARAEIDAVLKRAKAGEDFAKLAQAHSADGSAAQGGDLNFFARGQMVPAFDAAAFALKPGQISDVVTTQFGYHIIKVTEHKEPGTVPLEQAAERVKQFLTNQKKQERANAFIAGLKQKSKIDVLI